MSTALQICLGVLVVIFILAWLYTQMYPTPPPQGCNALPGNQARYPRETKPKPVKRNIWRREAAKRQQPRMWRSTREPRAQGIDRRVVQARGALKQFESAPSRDWHRTDRIRAQGQGLQQPNIQNGVQTSMLLENQRRAAAVSNGSRARARRLGDTPTWDRLRNQGVDMSPGITRQECIEWLNNPNIMQRSEDHICWQYADREGTMQDQVAQRLQRRQDAAEDQVEQAAEYMAENPDAGAPTEESDAPYERPPSATAHATALEPRRSPA